MNMYNPPHPGEFIYATYVEPYNVSEREIAKNLDVAASTFNRLIKGDSAVSPEMAYRLSKVLGRSPESWLAMQSQYDLAKTKKTVKLSKLKKINFDKIDKAA